MRVRLLLALSTLALTACGGGGTVSCSSDAECSGRGLVCDLGVGVCVECARDSDCLGADELCVGAGVCRTAATCESSRQCPGQVCRMGLGRCVDCSLDADCPAEQRCERFSCVARPPTCVADSDCVSLGLVCDEGLAECVQCAADTDCVDGFSCVDRWCRSARVDAGRADGGAGFDAGPRDGGRLDSGGADSGADAGGADAGGCTVSCPPRTNATVTCAGDVCGFVCDAPFADCDLSPANGCEVNTLTSLAHCSGCGDTCVAGDGAAAACVGGECQLSCDSGLGDCDQAPGNGCETDVTSDPDHCSGCGQGCPARANATRLCLGASCAFECTGAFADCDTRADNGCEVNTRRDAMHCGGCDAACPSRPGTRASCDGTCEYECRAGRFDCDGDETNGCESTESCPASMCSSTQSQCTRPEECQCLGCNDDGDCSADDDDCVCPDCAGDGSCTACDMNGVCDVFLEGCTCADCVGLPVCEAGAGGT